MNIELGLLTCIDIDSPKRITRPIVTAIVTPMHFITHIYLYITITLSRYVVLNIEKQLK